MKTALFSVIAVAVIALAAAAVVVYGFSAPMSRDAQRMEVVIAEGATVASIADDLEEKKLIRSPFFFTLYANITGKTAQLQAGTYAISSGDSIKYIVNQLSDGEGSNTDVKITIIEGWKKNDIRGYLKAQGLDVSDFDMVTAETSLIPAGSLLRGGLPKDATLEGYLFPDTYFVYRNSSTQDIVEKMIGNFEQRLTPDTQKKIKNQDRSFYDVLTLASIVEKEVSGSQDRRIAAGIFLKRLDDQYPLESDATVNYVTGKKTTRPSGDDLQTQSAYNTYQHVGLPPGPICNPSIDAIEAVLDAAPTEYYFFLTTPTNETVFSKTFEEHLQNRATYYP